MSYSHLEPLSKQFTIIIGLTVVGFMAFGLAVSSYRNALFEQTLEGIRDQNQELRSHIAEGYRDLEYYQSVQYKDKYAKENLGLLNPGEKLLIITEEIDKPITQNWEDPELTERQRVDAAYGELLRQMPVIDHWRMFLFHRERVEQLKSSL